MRSRNEMGNFLWRVVGLALVLPSIAPLVYGEVAAEEEVTDRNVVGGQDAPVGRFPYACTMRSGPYNEFRCSGVLVHPRIFLTAAHCVYEPIAGGVLADPVVYCRQEWRDTSVYGMVFSSRAQVADCYRGPNRVGCDIAFLVLHRAANVPVPQLPSFGESVPTNAHLTALGWGVMQLTPRIEPGHLQMADSIYLCNRYFSQTTQGRRPVDLNVCASGRRQDLCRGDSGGPLIIPQAPGGSIAAGNPYYDKVVGVDSRGSGPCDASSPQVFTQVSPFIDVIQRLIQQVETGSAQEAVTATT